ncbi:MAG: 50S ribosomal protein L9 [Bryobacterales bacterium]|nr:50S ribosomal protein L9 [Bryobacterales bacterium]MDE0629522.1 50S ribosomal protein L9 [Bryobacterales bacterium]
MVEVILKQDIFRLGDRGDVVRVAPGYARNYLYPQRLAIPADKGSLKQLAAMKAAADREAVRVRGDAEKQLSALEGVVIRVVARASLNNQLYGSVSARDVAARLAEIGIEVDRRRIQLTAPIRILGDYDVPIHIYKELSSTIKVEVRAEGREDEPLTRSLQSAAELEFAPAPVDEESEDLEGEGLEAEGAESGEPGDAFEELAAPAYEGETFAE